MSQIPISVTAFWKSAKGRYYLKWKEPGKTYSTRQTDITKKGQRFLAQAMRLAQELEDQLNARFSGGGPTTWEEFLVIYKDGRLKSKSRDNLNKWNAVVAIFDDVYPRHHHGILELGHITPKLLLAVEAEMANRISPGSVASYSATLRAGLSWAAKMGLMPMLPPRPPDTVQQVLPAMRLVPIAQESLERMEQAAKKVVGKQHAKGIADYMRCLWLSGCRLTEPVEMHAFRQDCHHPIVLDGDQPLFGWVNSQKNKRDQIARITIDFAEWIRPRCTGEWLFNPTCEHGRIEGKHQLSSIISEIGAEANIVAEPGKPPKHATAKHFRSSFVTRWSRRGMPIQLISQIVRHATVTTTEKYYLAPPDPEMMRSFVERSFAESPAPSKIRSM